MISLRLVHGLDDGELLDAHGAKLQRDVVGPLAAMMSAAAEASVSIALASGHRSFARQLAIWNRKASGSQRVLDANEEPLDTSAFPPDALVDAILRWSALPGASRHHWGTDIDVYDAAAVEPGYRVELTTAEAAQRFSAMHRWLDTHMHRFGFYRPYGTDRGGVAPEPWHLSYAPVACHCAAALSVSSLREVLTDADMALKTRVLARLPELFERYVLSVDPVPRECLTVSNVELRR